MLGARTRGEGHNELNGEWNFWAERGVCDNFPCTKHCGILCSRGCSLVRCCWSIYEVLGGGGDFLCESLFGEEEDLCV